MSMSRWSIEDHKVNMGLDPTAWNQFREEYANWHNDGGHPSRKYGSARDDEVKDDLNRFVRGIGAKYWGTRAGGHLLAGAPRWPANRDVINRNVTGWYGHQVLKSKLIRRYQPKPPLLSDDARYRTVFVVHVENRPDGEWTVRSLPLYVYNDEEIFKGTVLSIARDAGVPLDKWAQIDSVHLFVGNEEMTMELGDKKSWDAFLWLIEKQVTQHDVDKITVWSIQVNVELPEDTDISEDAGISEDGDISEDTIIPKGGDISEDTAISEDGDISEDGNISEDGDYSESGQDVEMSESNE